MQLVLRIGFTTLLLVILSLFSSVASHVTGMADLASPADGAVVHGMAEVRGSALLDSALPNDFDYYRLEYSRVDDKGQFIFEGETVRTIPVRDGLLDMWNTNLVPNGTYVIRLVVMSRSGRSEQTSISVIVSNDIPVRDRSAASEARLWLPFVHS